MKTIEQILDYQGGKGCNAIDGRDKSRLASFLTFDQLKRIGVETKDGVTAEEWNKDVEPFTEENVKKYLATDLAFAFEKALNKRGISSGLMFEVIKMWMWVLDDGLADFDEYPMYGLPLYKRVAEKYGLPNPIGADTGSEEKYDERYE